MVTLVKYCLNWKLTILIGQAWKLVTLVKHSRMEIGNPGQAWSYRIGFLVKHGHMEIGNHGKVLYHMEIDNPGQAWSYGN